MPHPTQPYLHHHRPSAERGPTTMALPRVSCGAGASYHDSQFRRCQRPRIVDTYHTGQGTSMTHPGEPPRSLPSTLNGIAMRCQPIQGLSPGSCGDRNLQATASANIPTAFSPTPTATNEQRGCHCLCLYQKSIMLQ